MFIKEKSENMRIGILADTHLRAGQHLPARVYQELVNTQLILHAGDILTAQLLEDLSYLAPVRAVRGNCDGWELAHLPTKDTMEIEGWRIGLVHGNAGVGKTTPDRALNTFAGDNVNIVVFGHSHIPYLQQKDGILLFNPGSPTDKRSQPDYSLGIIEVSAKTVDARHIYF